MSRHAAKPLQRGLKQPTERPTMYTAQINEHGNVIVCKGDTVRNSYRIIFTGTYAECLMVKADQASRQVSFNDYANRRASV